MIIGYIKGTKLVGFTNNNKGGIPDNYDKKVYNLTEEDIYTLNNGGTYIDGQVIPKTYTDEELYEQKKEECQQRILSYYSRSDQANITGDAMVSGDNTELTKMRTFINAMLDELHTNGKDADFSTIEPL